MIFCPARRHFRRANPGVDIHRRRDSGRRIGRRRLAGRRFSHACGAIGTRGISIVGALAGFFISTILVALFFLCVEIALQHEKSVQNLIRERFPSSHDFLLEIERDCHNAARSACDEMANTGIDLLYACITGARVRANASKRRPSNGRSRASRTQTSTRGFSRRSAMIAPQGPSPPCGW